MVLWNSKYAHKFATSNFILLLPDHEYLDSDRNMEIIKGNCWKYFHITDFKLQNIFPFQQLFLAKNTWQMLLPLKQMVNRFWHFLIFGNIIHGITWSKIHLECCVAIYRLNLKLPHQIKSTLFTLSYCIYYISNYAVCALL